MCGTKSRELWIIISVLSYSLSHIGLLTFDNSRIFPGSESMMSLEEIFDEKVLRKVKSIKKILNAEQSIFGK